MAEQKHPGWKSSQKARALRCEEWETLLVDALDGVLPATDSAAFEAHAEECKACAELLAHTKQGREWLGYLHSEPEIPVDLVSKILSRTTGAEGIPLVVAAGPQPVAAAYVRAIPLRRSFYETRLLMTAAMAFFSIALTLNLAGIHLTSLRLADLKPSAIQGTISRQFYDTKKQVVQYYNNQVVTSYDHLRLAYQIESRVRELRRDVEEQPSATPSKDTKDNGAKPGHSRSGNPSPNAGRDARHDVPQTTPQPVSRSGGMQLASFRFRGNRMESMETARRQNNINKSERKETSGSVVRPLVVAVGDGRAECRSGRQKPLAGDHERSLA